MSGGNKWNEFFISFFIVADSLSFVDWQHLWGNHLFALSCLTGI